MKAIEVFIGGCFVPIGITRFTDPWRIYQQNHPWMAFPHRIGNSIYYGGPFYSTCLALSDCLWFSFSTAQ